LGQNRDNEQLEAVSVFIDQGLIDEVLGVVKSGKEATVYCCSTSGRSAPLLAAKVYRSRNVRRFSNDAVYTAGRQRQKHRREARAIENRSRFGREAAFEKWVADEYETLSILHRAGADVPEPIAMSGPVIMMEYIGDAEEPAPPLSSVTLGRDEADGLFRRLLRNIELALACDRVHGDLSAFNVLYRPGAPCIIDFPQAVDPRFNPNALALLERDIENLHGYFARYGIRADPGHIARDLWGRFLRSEL
jgi:RIO kinase 1